MIPQALWFGGVRRNVYALFVLSLVINVGMWLERFIIVVVSLHRDYLPSSWDMYVPTFWDWSTYIGTIGLFAALMFLFIRLLPMISIFEMREMVEESHERTRMSTRRQQFRILAEFAEPDELVAAARSIHEAGYRDVEAYSPMPVEGLAEAVGFPPHADAAGRADWRNRRLPGRLGACSTILTVIAYPLNIGGRPLNSWPSFVPVIFEMTVLFAALSAVLGMLAMNGLPRPHHPLFAIPQFDRATQDRFFLCILAHGSDVSPAVRRASFSSGSGPRRSSMCRCDIATLCGEAASYRAVTAFQSQRVPHPLETRDLSRWRGSSRPSPPFRYFRLRARDVQPAALRATGGERGVRRWHGVAAACAGHGCPRPFGARQPFFTGKADGQLVSELPDAALAGTTMTELLARGRERYNIFCSHCHGRVGGGIGGDPEFEPLVGMVVQRGFPAPPTYHQDRLRRAPIGHFST